MLQERKFDAMVIGATAAADRRQAQGCIGRETLAGPSEASWLALPRPFSPILVLVCAFVCTNAKSDLII